MDIHYPTAEQGAAPLPDIDLKALFNEAIPPEGLPPFIEADGVFFLTLSVDDRIGIATTVERLIDILDALDTDPDREETGDNEHWLGWPGNGPHALECDSEDREEENEAGDDINDEPQDDGELEPYLGWAEACGNGAPLGNVPGTVAFMDDAEAGDGALDFRGEGRLQARGALRRLTRSERPHCREVWQERSHRMPDGTIFRIFVIEREARS